MLSKEEQEKMAEQLNVLYSKIELHKFHYALEKLGLEKKVETVVKELKGEGLSVNDYELGGEKSEIHIPFDGGKITLKVTVAPPIPIPSFTPHLYEVSYFIDYTNLDNALKASKILKKHKFKSLHQTEPLIIPTPFFER